ncbi:glycosyltransferase [Motilibacter aurantiacus]|uniref:glycosyltransferase n=1 Tax=Motilibacter aurantiacus TaxID=2714955 RepID=UPI00140D3350|nr:glycosyltransferase [Motilibacter aurantiacus]NHC45758.1 glycosyltransferase [Motilibacter aurantiacus]
MRTVDLRDRSGPPGERPLRIALVTGTTRARPHVVHTLALAEALGRLGQDVTVWGLGRGAGAGFYRHVHPAVGLQVVPVAEDPAQPAPERAATAAAVLRDVFRAYDYDVVHAQDPVSAAAVGACVRTVHDLEPAAPGRPLGPAGAYAHVCLSSALAARLAKEHATAATVIPPGVDAARFVAAADEADPVATAARRSWRSRLGRYVLAVGPVEERLRTLELVEAFAALGPELEDVRLVLACPSPALDDPAYRTLVDARAAHLGVRPLVLAGVPEEEMPALVAAASAVAVACAEGATGPALEALAAGVPVVLPDAPQVRETFGGAVALAASPAAMAWELGELVHAPDPAMRRAGRALAARHTWEAAAAAHVALYRRFAAPAALGVSRAERAGAGRP